MLKIEVNNRCVGVTSAGSTHEMLREMTWAVASFLNSIELKRPDGVTKVTDEEAIVAALNTGKLRGAGIDVLCEEPMRDDHPYLTAKNCYVTPHVAWGSIEARTRLIDIVADNLQAYQNGKPQNCVGAFKG